MAINYMVYDYEKVMQALEMIKSFNFTPPKRKIEHTGRCYLVKDLCEELWHLTGDFLFNQDWKGSYINNYIRIVYGEGYTKKDMDKELKNCKLFIQGEIKSLIHMIHTGECKSNYEYAG